MEIYTQRYQPSIIYKYNTGQNGCSAKELIPGSGITGGSYVCCQSNWIVVRPGVLRLCLITDSVKASREVNSILTLQKPAGFNWCWCHGFHALPLTTPTFDFTRKEVVIIVVAAFLDGLCYCRGRLAEKHKIYTLQNQCIHKCFLPPCPIPLKTRQQIV